MACSCAGAPERRCLAVTEQQAALHGKTCLCAGERVSLSHVRVVEFTGLTRVHVCWKRQHGKETQKLRRNCAACHSRNLVTIWMNLKAESLQDVSVHMWPFLSSCPSFILFHSRSYLILPLLNIFCWYSGDLGLGVSFGQCKLENDLHTLMTLKKKYLWERETLI